MLDEDDFVSQVWRGKVDLRRCGKREVSRSVRKNAVQIRRLLSDKTRGDKGRIK